MENKIKILFVEDDTDLRDSLIDCLELHDYYIKGVPNALSFYQELAKDSYDIALIDIGLPDQSGLEIVSYLKANHQMGIVVLTAMAGSEFRIKGYKSGADLYLVKPTRCTELAAAISNLVTRLKPPSNPPTQPDERPWTLNSTELQLISSSGLSINLSLRETKFLEILMSQSGNQVNRLEISQTLNIPDKSNKTGKDRRIDTMTRRLRQKVKNNSGVDLPIKTVYGEGYIFSGITQII